MKITDLPLSSKGKSISFSGNINQLHLNDNGAVDVVLDTEDGIIRIFLDAQVAANYDITLGDSVPTSELPAPPAPEDMPNANS